MSRKARYHFCPYCAQDAGRGTFCQVCGTRLAQRAKETLVRDAASSALAGCGTTFLLLGGAVSACGAISVAGGTEYGVPIGGLSVGLGIMMMVPALLVLLATRGRPAGAAQVTLGSEEGSER